jgi:hypothetical protein
VLRTLSVVALPISVAALLASASPSNGQPFPLRSADVAKLATQQPRVGDPPPEVSGTYITFDVPSSSFLGLEGINPRGDIVGEYFDTINNFWQNFLLSDGTFSLTNPPGPPPPACCGSGWLVTTSGINPRGDIVGSANDSTGTAVGFLLSHGAYSDIKVPGAGCGIGTLPAGINPRGDVVGFYFDDATCGSHGFLLSKGTYTAIDVPAALGAGATAPGTTIATAINPRGDILGTYNDSSFTVHSFLLSKKGEFTAIPDVPAPGATTYALGMNPQGDIVGWSCCGPLGGFLLSQGTISTIDVPESCGSSCTVPYGITPKGDIVGSYLDNNGNHGFLLKR